VAGRDVGFGRCARALTRKTTATGWLASGGLVVPRAAASGRGGLKRAAGRGGVRSQAAVIGSRGVWRGAARGPPARARARPGLGYLG
jgi:hypothetical protein